MLTVLILENHPFISSLGVYPERYGWWECGYVVNSKKNARRGPGVSILTNQYVNKFQRISS